VVRRYRTCSWAKLNALLALFAYVSVIAAAVIGIAILGKKDAQSAAHAVEAVATLPLMGGAKSANAVPRVLRSMASGSRSEPVIVESDAFPHVRPAPPMFQHLSDEDIAELKTSAVERIVEDDATPWHHGESQTYKTVCVRLCDGAYFPISFATTRSHFAKDEAQCAARCGSPARLFVFPNPGGNPEMMRDRSGRSYVALPTAFQFRHGPVADCSCRAAPWEAASRARHRLYTLEANVAAGKPVDTAELASLRRQVANATVQPSQRLLAIQTSMDSKTASTLRDEGSVQADGEFSPVPAMPAPPPDHVRILPPEQEIAALDLTEQSATDLAVSGHLREQFFESNDVPPPPVRPPVELKGIGPGRIASQTKDLDSGTRVKKLPSQKPMRRQVRQGSDSDAGSQRRIPRGLATTQAIWGMGPNAYGAPRGSSARDTFARNFF